MRIVRPVSRPTLVLSTVLCSASCGPEPAVDVFDEVCGVAGPFRVLELPPDQQLYFSTPKQLGDRSFYVVSEIAELAPDASFPTRTGTTVWATGPCGEAPRSIATGMDYVFTVDRWPGELLACTEAGDIVRLDPTGEQPAHVVFPDVPDFEGCGLKWGAQGLIRLEDHGDDTASLLLYPYPADPRDEPEPPRVLFSPIRVDSAEESLYAGPHTFWWSDDSVHALRPDGTLARVALADGQVTELRSDVARFTVGRDRWVLWQSAQQDHEDEVFLLDEQTGDELFLGHDALTDSVYSLQFVDHGYIQTRHADVTRLYSLPDLEFVDIPADLDLWARVDDGRFLAANSWFGSYELLDLTTGTRTPLFDGEAVIADYLLPDAIDLLAVPPCCILGSEHDEGPIWRVPLDGSAPRKIVERGSHNTRRLDDGRYLGPLGFDDAWRAPLVLADPETGAELQLDDRVFGTSLDHSRIDDDGLITYSVADGDRSGIYVARLPASPRSRAGAASPPSMPDRVDGPRRPPPNHIVTRAR